MKNNVHKIFYCLIIILIIVVDQIVKYLSVVFLKPVSTIPVLDGVFHLTYCENTGAAFSIFEGARWFFIIITSLFVIFILFLVFSGRVQSVVGSYLLSVVAAGGIGNLIDRIYQGYVVDMFDFRLINFAIFNVADIAVTCGGIAFVILYFVKKGEIIKWKR